MNFKIHVCGTSHQAKTLEMILKLSRVRHFVAENYARIVLFATCDEYEELKNRFPGRMLVICPVDQKETKPNKLEANHHWISFESEDDIVSFLERINSIPT